MGRSFRAEFIGAMGGRLRVGYARSTSNGASIRVMPWAGSLRLALAGCRRTLAPLPCTEDEGQSDNARWASSTKCEENKRMVSLRCGRADGTDDAYQPAFAYKLAYAYSVFAQRTYYVN